MFHVNLYYVLTVVVIAAGGIPKGYDEGGFSASVGLKSFQNDFNLVTSHWQHDASGLANRTGNITSLAVLGAALGSLSALFLNERLGRLQSWRISAIVWASGLLIQIFSSGILGLLLVARVWGGLGAGALTVVTPLYLSEIAPARSRGRIASCYMILPLLFLAVGFFINYAASLHMSPTRMQYRLVQSIPLIPVGMAFCCTFFLTDTPRWLAFKGRREEALAALKQLRSPNTSHASLLKEYAEIDAQIQNRISQKAKGSLPALVKEIATVATYRTRFLLVIFMATVAQWSGGNGITYYIPQIFEYAGVTGGSVSLLSSGAYGITKLVFTLLFAWCLVDFVGRRPCFLFGLILQLAAHIYMAVYTHHGLTARSEASSAVAIASVFWYAVGWSIGLCMIQSLYAVEIFPTHIRGVAYAASMAVHWFFQFAVVRITPNLFVSTNVWGAFVFWAAICAFGLVLLFLWAPETKAVPMERMGELFAGRWWMGWKAKLSTEEPNRSEEDVATSFDQEDMPIASMERVERGWA